MTATLIPPARHPDLVVRPLGKGGEHVIKDPRREAHFKIGTQEAFLLESLDGQKRVEQICVAFQDRFQEPLSPEELTGFVELARSHELLQEDSAGNAPGPPSAISHPVRRPVPARRKDYIPPARRPDLVIRPFGSDGQHVVKDPYREKYFKIGAQETFLLECLDGQRTAEKICVAFQDRFQEPLTLEDLKAFVQMARSQKFLQVEARGKGPCQASSVPQPVSLPAPPRRKIFSGQNILYWRINFYDPDRLFNWLMPKLAWVCTWTFVLVSLAVVLAAAGVFASNVREIFSPGVFHWKWLVLGWFVLMVVSTCHECAHGLTCKRFGGEVHEMGFLMMFFIPCFYCNVSDAWLFRDKSRRLWVTVAGPFCDLCLWALAVLAWRVLLPGTAPHFVAWCALTICGIRVFLNFNPLMKMDGYYFLSDWMDLPNLRQRSRRRMMAHARWLLWGAARPAPEDHGKFLLVFGLICWCFKVVFLSLFVFTLFHVLEPRVGLLALGLSALLGIYLWRRYFRGITAGEVWQMLKFRYKRALVWLAILVGVPGLLFAWHLEDRVSGSFRFRPTGRAEVRAPVSGFLQSVYFDEGQWVSAGTVIARLDIPDLASRQTQKRAEIRESQAKLRLVEAGPRLEVIIEQRYKVERAREWCNLAKEHLGQKQKVLAEDLAKCNQAIVQAQKEADYQTLCLERAKDLLRKRSLSVENYQEVEKQQKVAQAQLAQAKALKAARLAQGTLEDETELAKREKELADTRAVLKLLEAGTRPEEIDAHRAQLARLQEEERYLKTLKGKIDIRCSVAGFITTPHLRDKAGQYLKEGDLICEIEDPSRMEAEISLAEQEVSRVEAGNLVELKVRALPFDTFQAKVDRIAPAAGKGEKMEQQGTVTVGCLLEATAPELRPGMTGYARIYCGTRPVALILAHKVVRYFRTEFWW
jgi:putative peptide zinc metalloprotease protein